MEMIAFFEGSDFQEESLEVIARNSPDDGVELFVLEWKDSKPGPHPIYLETKN